VVQRAEEKAKELETKGQVEAAKTVSEFAARARQQAASNEMALQQNMAPSVALTQEAKRAAKASPAHAEGRVDSRGYTPAPPAAAPVQVANSVAADATVLGGEKDALASTAAAKKAETGTAVVAVVAEAASGPPASSGRPVEPRRSSAATTVFDVKETPFRPFWVEHRLLLARTVSMPDGEYLQGCWLDWNAIRDSLRKAVADLLPEVELLPAATSALDEPGRLLAALPVRLQPGPLPQLGADGLSPAILVLVVGWACALVSGIAAAMLLQQALVLGERRGAFVSAVTHELRTPLTTFRMYAELLHLGMVEDESERKALLETLVVESDRLDHLVKNVLSFARLESGRGMASLQIVPVTELLERGCERLSQRAAQAGMRVELQVPEELADAATRTDPSVVEQILFNLVDNACKYASAGPERRILIQAARVGSRLALRVKDHGPGIARADRRKLFRPFHKSAREAARSAPGVGLGLALCRRLALSLGGDLRLENGAEEGACFVLDLPLAQDGR
jgi:signal transduction histidine kinase